VVSEAFDQSIFCYGVIVSGRPIHIQWHAEKEYGLTTSMRAAGAIIMPIELLQSFSQRLGSADVNYVLANSPSAANLVRKFFWIDVRIADGDGIDTGTSLLGRVKPLDGTAGSKACH
jgi:hypothetical protein